MKHLYLYLLTAMLICISITQTFGQTIPKYAMKFELRDSQGVLRDTMMSRIKYKFWGNSENYPEYVNWKEQPFAICPSNIHGIGLFTDSTSSFSTDDTVGYVFVKRMSTGNFNMDYLETNIGSFINDSETPNLEVILTTNGLLIKAKTNISPNTELTASYREIIGLFPGDVSVERTLRYW